MMLRVSKIKLGFPLLTQRLASFEARKKSVIEKAAVDGELRVFIVAGEVSGDNIGSRLMCSLKKLSPLPLRFHGVGGSMMCKQGLTSLFPMEDLAVMGLWELLPHLYKFRVKLKETIDAAAMFKPHVVVTVDSKGFSFRLLKQLRARYNQQHLENSAVHFHYVAPSFWAWKGGESRLGGLSEFVDHLFCILPNEESVCREHGVEATFVGHPLLEDINLVRTCKPQESKLEGLSKYSLPSEDSTVISVLPGSRLQEVERMLPIFSKAMKLLKDPFPNLVTLIHVASNSQVDHYIGKSLPQWPVPAILVPSGSTQLKYDAFGVSQAALCTSGTVAVELQLACLPSLVAYRAHFLTELFIRYKAKIPYISLPNILLDSPIIPEALFRACNPSNLALILERLLLDEEMRGKQVVAAEKLARLLHPSESGMSSKLVHYSDLDSHRYTPSNLAASTILSYAKR
ncbi:probable lipid-A-disaccharide synthase, mitochondrial isoform X1 [Brassica rapa]|uniref:probable lipid-A-disaccharide synthase, mitochondrial isoform X1 n=1 Tax=Brassica campestris TaxID=3711 RepID=UPI0004F1B0D0|nr:probable lipid-A-disaccharide synthase, mitochondrial isoform X1 [Brassica rapa]